MRSAALNLLADRVTAISQPGSLPIYAGVILTTAALVPLWALTRGECWPGWPDVADDSGARADRRRS